MGEDVISLDVADRIASAVLEQGEHRGLEPLAVAVLDAGGHVVVVKRGDGAAFLRTEIAYSKAWGALGMGRSSRSLAASAQQRPEFYEALVGVSGGRMVPAPGGVLIRDAGDRRVGAVGVSGDSSEADEECAAHAITVAGFVVEGNRA